MSCPDRIQFLLALEDNDLAALSHARNCPDCGRVAQAEDRVFATLSRLRDPAPPSDLLSRVMTRVDGIEAQRAAARRETVTALFGSLAVMAMLVILLGAQLVSDRAATAVELLSGGRALVGAFCGPVAHEFALPMLFAEALMVCAAILYVRRVLAERRSLP